MHGRAGVHGAGVVAVHGMSMPATRDARLLDHRQRCLRVRHLWQPLAACPGLRPCAPGELPRRCGRSALFAHLALPFGIGMRELRPLRRRRMRTGRVRAAADQQPQFATVLRRQRRPCLRPGWKRIQRRGGLRRNRDRQALRRDSSPTRARAVSASPTLAGGVTRATSGTTTRAACSARAQWTARAATSASRRRQDPVANRERRVRRTPIAERCASAPAASATTACARRARSAAREARPSDAMREARAGSDAMTAPAVACARSLAARRAVSAPQTPLRGALRRISGITTRAASAGRSPWRATSHRPASIGAGRHPAISGPFAPRTATASRGISATTRAPARRASVPRTRSAATARAPSAATRAARAGR